MKRTAQGGSIRNFIVVAVLLIGVIAGGIYILKQQNQPAEPLPDEGVSVVEEEPQQKETSPEKIEELPGSAVAEELPQTGAAENIGMVIAAGLVSAVIVYYFRSRQPELSL